MISLNATKARQNFFEILLAARDKKQITKISYQGKLVAKLVPIAETKFNWKKYIREQKKMDRLIRQADWSDLKNFRKELDKGMSQW